MAETTFLPRTGHIRLVPVSDHPSMATGPKLTCPHCRKVNIVAGFYEAPADRIWFGSPDAVKESEKVTCGFCGKRFFAERRDEQ